MVVPDGFALPPWPELAVLLIGAVAVGVVLWRMDPPVTGRTVLAFTPWMALGGALHVYTVRDIAPGIVDPFLGTPAVYVATAILAGATWIGAFVVSGEDVDIPVAAVGALCLVLAVGGLVLAGLRVGRLSPWWPFGGLVIAVLLSGLLWFGLDRLDTPMAAVAGWAGFALVFGHVLDGISTAIGVDVLEGGERSPLPRAIMRIGEYLPTAEVIGVGWLFVLVKVLAAVGILWLFVPFIRDTERQGYAVLVLLTAVGLGPGTHNLLLFLVSA